MLVSFLGPVGTNTHAAALAAFGSVVEFLPEPTIGAVFRAVESGRAEHGVVPIENSTEGVVRETIDELLGTNLTLERELELEIRHELMGPPGLEPSAAKRVVSHPQALAQCRGYLDRCYSTLERSAASSTAAAAREVAARSDSLAIASRLAAEENSLVVHDSGIADRAHNTTRFVAISKNATVSTGRDRTTVVLRAAHERGALLRLLAVLDECQVNLTRIESRPLPDKRWEYAFVVDVEGHRLDAGVERALATLDARGAIVRILGSYPRAGS